MYLKVWKDFDSWQVDEPSLITGVEDLAPSGIGGFAIELNSNTLVLPPTVVVEIFES